jgi:hypothetical protein
VPRWEHTVWMVSRMADRHDAGGTLEVVDGVPLPAGGEPFLPALRRAGDESWELAGMTWQGHWSVLILKRPGAR